MELLAAEDIQEKLLKTEKYCLEQNVSAAIAQAELAHVIVDEIVAFLKPGILESQAKAFALQCFEKHAIERTWHPPYVRFGEHTLLTFMDKAKEDRTLGEEDIAFIDIGVVKGGIEGDAGRTVVFGRNVEMQKLAAASKAIYDEAVSYWQKHNPTGIALYEYIYSLADKMEMRWNLDPAGHLIGAFPHRGWKRGINNFPQKVENGCWILEVQIRHPQLPLGAFYEDLLYSH